jgi:hypothetical protein
LIDNMAWCAFTWWICNEYILSCALLTRRFII